MAGGGLWSVGSAVPAGRAVTMQLAPSGDVTDRSSAAAAAASAAFTQPLVSRPAASTATAVVAKLRCGAHGRRRCSLRASVDETSCVRVGVYASEPPGRGRTGTSDYYDVVIADGRCCR